MSIRRGGHTKEIFDITVEYIFSTEKAIKYSDGNTEFWVPKSLMGDDGDIQVEANPDGSFTLTAPVRWLTEKGLI
jgi:hypothetical protein